MSLRKRKNPLSSSTLEKDSEVTLRNNAEKQRLREHSKLMKKIYATTDDDYDDEEVKEMKKMIMNYQIKKSDEMKNSFIRVVSGMVVILMFLYVLVLSYESTDEPSVMNSLIKVLRILFGMKNKPYLSSSQIVAFTSVAKATIDEFLIPSWPWERESSAAKKYLVPDKYKPVKHILHESMKLKYQRGLNVELYDEDMMRDFLFIHRKECGNEIGKSSDNYIIVEKFDELKQRKDERSIDRKNLWLWCMIYTGETFGHLDIDNYEIKMTSNLLRKLSLGSRPYGIENVLISPNLEEHEAFDGSSVSSLLMLSTSILFVSIPKSRVAKGMLDFILTSSSNEHSQIEELKRLVQLVGSEEKDRENWVLLKAHCTKNSTGRGDENKLATVCDKSEEIQQCCNLVL